MFGPLIQYPLITHLCNYFCYPVPRPPSWSCAALRTFKDRRLKITIIIIIIIRTARKKKPSNQTTCDRTKPSSSCLRLLYRWRSNLKISNGSTALWSSRYYRPYLFWMNRFPVSFRCLFVWFGCLFVF